MSLKTSCIIHPKSHPFVRIMRWQIEACDNNTCAAALLSMFEAWHNWKIEQAVKAGKLNDISELHGFGRSQDESLYQWHNEEDLVKSILGIYGRVTIGKAIKLLVEKQFVSVHRNPDTRAKFDRTRFFLFEVANVQIWINANYPSTIALDEPSAKSGGWSANNGAPSAKNESASAKSGSRNAKNGASYKESTETNKENRPKKQQQSAEAKNVVVDYSDFSIEIDPISQAELLQEMNAIGVSPKVANEFISNAEITPEMIRLQLDCLSDREPHDAAATFVSAVRGNWSPPGDYHKRLEAADAAKIARAAREQRAAAEAREMAARDAEAAQFGARAAQLDAIWENLDDDDKALVKREVFKHNDGDISTMDHIRQRIADGRGLPAIDRRAAIETLLEKQMLPDGLDDETDVAAPAPQIAPTAPRQTAATSPPLAASQADMMFNVLPDVAKARIESQVEERLRGMPETLRTDEGRIQIRRALIIDFIAQATDQTTGNATPKSAADEATKTA